ncbi:choice-of-anchor L domain-containing protein [Aureivirga marina]|uniref:choice-of-anchor L domain-containing protein n=1 Tax=Aureivirga marina TaxID=1182451 RepID=UPI0018CAB39C|nr:choice-of-anchor L domain-containing protein [Aureivirga marina]
MVKKLLFSCIALFAGATAFSQTIQVNPETISASTMEPESLVREVLLAGECVDMTWIDDVTNPEYGPEDREDKSYGFFKRVTENFPFQNGIIMTSGKAYRSGNEVITSTLSDSDTEWYNMGDDHLLSIIQNSSYPRNAVRNVTIFEFEFVPLVENLEFNYIFASEEYGSFECTFSDVFAFILNGPGINDVNEYDGDANGNTPPVSLDLGGKNIAVVPGTTIPVMVTNVHSGVLCDIEQETYEYYDAVNSGNGAINYNAQTVVFTAEHPVTPGETYTIKLAIGDAGDSAYDSAVFLEGGSFDLGELPAIGQDLTETGGNALCENGGSVVIGYNEDDIATIPSIVEYQFVKVEGEDYVVVQEAGDNYTFEVFEPGTYLLQVLYPSGCAQESNPVIIEFYDLPDNPTASFMEDCTVDDVTIFDLESKISEILEGEDPNTFEVKFFNSLEAAEDFDTDLSITEKEVQGNTTETIFVRITNINTIDNPNLAAPCYYPIFTFDLRAFLTPSLVDASDVEKIKICDNESYGTLEDNIAYFDLTERQEVLLSGYSTENYTIQYAKDADFNNLIADPTSYANVDSPLEDIVYVRLINNLNENCIGNTSFKLEVEPYESAECSITYPEGFSPNGNGINDTFYIKGLIEEYPNYKIEFFNRWGNKVYTDSQGNYWNGQLDGDGKRAPAGVYFYVLYYNDGAKGPEQRKLFLNR